MLRLPQNFLYEKNNSVYNCRGADHPVNGTNQQKNGATSTAPTS
jgi:hypothetical protein